MSSSCPSSCSAQTRYQQHAAPGGILRKPLCYSVQPFLVSRRAQCRRQPCSTLSCRHDKTHPSTSQVAPSKQSQQQKSQALAGTALKAIAVLAALNVSSSSPALAELQTVPASQATELAKPIPKQKTDKGFVALLFAGGAASIFGAAVLLEKNSRLFPAIHKANQVMREAELRSKGQSLAEQAVVDLEQQDEMRLQRSVEAGLANAQARVLPDNDGGSSSASTSSTGRTEADGSQSAAGTPSSTNGVSQQSHNEAQQAQSDSEASSSSERPKGSQLSAAEKQKQAVNSVS